MHAIAPPAPRSPLHLEAEQASPERAARIAAERFEVLVARELMKAMRATTGGDELLGSATASETLYGMLDDAVSDAVAGRLGLAGTLTRAFLPPGPGPAARTALRSSLRAAGGPSRTAPLVGPDSLPGIPWTLTASPPLARGIVTSPFGPRVHPVTKTPSFHAGLDVAAPEGTEIYAVQAGVVRFAGPHGTHGLMVEIEHADGSRTRYAHASRLHVRRGDRVDAGEAVADVGATGRATGPHLHFEVRVAGRAVDPMPYLERLGVTDLSSAPPSPDARLPRKTVVARPPAAARHAAESKHP